MQWGGASLPDVFDAPALPLQPGAPPRVALSWGLADGAFEAPAFDLAAHGPFPPLQVRP